MAEYKLSYTAKEIDEKLGKVDTLVASVNGVTPDENGNVNISVGSGGGTGVSVQPDYTQNDETATDYIKNRPFYLKGENVIYDADITTVEESDTAVSDSYELSLVSLLNEGDNVCVKYNNSSYNCTYTDFYLGNIGGCFIIPFVEALSEAYGVPVEVFLAEEPELAALYVDTGEPFAILASDDGTVMFYTKEAGTHHVTLSVYEYDFDNTFISLLQPNYSETDSSKPSYVKNKLVYKNYIGNSETRTIYFGKEYAGVGMDVTEPVIFLDNNKQYSIMYNGKELFTSVQNITLNDTSNWIFGNAYIFLRYYALIMNTTINELLLSQPEYSVFNNDTGEPYFMVFDEADSNNSMILFYDETLASMTGEQVSRSCTIREVDVKKLDSSMIDWAGGAPITGGSSLPEVTTDDNDKVMMVIDGEWKAGSIANGDEVAY